MVNGERLNAGDERESHGGINGDGEGVGSVHDDVDLGRLGSSQYRFLFSRSDDRN